MIASNGKLITGVRELQDAMRKLLADPTKTNVVPVLVQMKDDRDPMFHIYWREGDSDAVDE